MTASPMPGDDEKSSGIPLEGQAVPAPYLSHAAGRDCRECFAKRDEYNGRQKFWHTFNV